MLLGVLNPAFFASDSSHHTDLFAHTYMLDCHTEKKPQWSSAVMEKRRLAKN
jgi:hypothetical protein